VDFRFATGIDDMELAAEFLRRFLELRGLESDFGVVWIEQQSDDASVGNELKQKLQLLRYNIATEPADSGNVSARLVEASDDTCLDWIVAEREHDRDRRSRRLGGNDRRSAADCNDHRHRRLLRSRRERPRRCAAEKCDEIASFQGWHGLSPSRA